MVNHMKMFDVIQFNVMWAFLLCNVFSCMENLFFFSRCEILKFKEEYVWRLVLGTLGTLLQV